MYGSSTAVSVMVWWFWPTLEQFYLNLMAIAQLTTLAGYIGYSPHQLSYVVQVPGPPRGVLGGKGGEMAIRPYYRGHGL
jgi:hypothetical protein